MYFFEIWFLCIEILRNISCFQIRDEKCRGRSKKMKTCKRNFFFQKCCLVININDAEKNIFQKNVNTRAVLDTTNVDLYKNPIV